MPILLLVILLGIVEGLTEYLPVSSTGHLILATELLGFDAERWALFNVAIQPGAILAVVVLYWRTFRDVLVGMFKREPSAWRFTRNILIAFAPAVVIALMIGVPLLLADLLREQRRLLAQVREQTGRLTQLRAAETGEAAARERVRIARDVHDVVGNDLSAIAVQAGAGSWAAAGSANKTDNRAARLLTNRNTNPSLEAGQSRRLDRCGR